MQEFQSITRSSSVEQAELTYKEACNSPTSKKYGNWKTDLQSLGKEKSRNVWQSIPTTMQRLQCDCTKT